MVTGLFLFFRALLYLYINGCSGIHIISSMEYGQTGGNRQHYFKHNRNLPAGNALKSFDLVDAVKKANGTISQAHEEAIQTIKHIAPVSTSYIFCVKKCDMQKDIPRIRKNLDDIESKVTNLYSIIQTIPS